MKVELSGFCPPAPPNEYSPRPLAPRSQDSSVQEEQHTEWGIDKTVLLSNCVGNSSFAASLLTEFGRTGLEHVQTILSHALAERFHETSLSAHSLKGSAAIVGAKKLSALAASVERSSKVIDRDQLATQLVELEREMSDCLQQIPSIRLSIGNQLTNLPSERTVITGCGEYQHG